MKRHVASLLQVAGVVALAVAAADVAWSFGVAVGGLGALAFGVARERVGGDG